MICHNCIHATVCQYRIKLVDVFESIIETTFGRVSTAVDKADKCISDICQFKKTT
jgi:hypothetical protein